MFEIVEITDIALIAEAESIIPEFPGTYIREKLPRLDLREPYLLLATADCQVVGFLAAYDRYGGSTHYLWMVGVAPDYRQQGIFRAMYEHYVEWARQHGVAWIVLKTLQERREMMAFAAGAGYRVSRMELGLALAEEELQSPKITLVKQLV